MLEDHAFSIGGLAPTRPEAKAGEATTAKRTLRVCASGDGAADTTQHVLPERETEIGDFSACSTPMCSHSVLVCEVAHSLACPCISTQAETGRHSRHANPRTISTLRILRIFTPIHSTTSHAKQPLGAPTRSRLTPRKIRASLQPSPVPKNTPGSSNLFLVGCRPAA